MMRKFLLTIFLLGAFVAATPAQSKADQTIANARDEFFDIKNRSIEMERMKREAYKLKFSENFTLKFPEIKEDFERIQKINDELLKLTAAKTSLNNSTVSKFVSEINRRAVRLRSNLFPAEPERKKEAKNKQPISVESKDVRTLLAVLDESINSFVHSSLFQNINLVNMADSLKAQKDLEAIINASSTIEAKTKNAG
ncbi:MAG: hypothetical protein AVDCRST_MAG74-722 [uncultured Pyrinomonadaceae bacterium]|uniref:Uncharacterized protein n=1 Tax=uncultured Pyrinomonadaceae bacterium TaxID=2283094 RepID=A0A6J4NCC9_9BACT|nr:MAG: hypothetical protein AVDCRST_MAG74-722 [uncultured Pyrinomonadaceae bacterium]